MSNKQVVGKIEQLTTNIPMSKTDAKKLLSEVKGIMKSAENVEELKKLKKELITTKNKLWRQEQRNKDLLERLEMFRKDQNKALEIISAFRQLTELAKLDLAAIEKDQEEYC